MKKWKKRTLTGLSLFTIVFFAAGLIVGNFFYNLALNPTTDKTSVVESEHNEFSIDWTAYNNGRSWFDDMEYATWGITSYDGLSLHAYVLENPSSNMWIITNHGYGGHATQLSYAAKEFYDMGFSVLMPDARGHGRSGGEYWGMGWHDRLDLVDWINTLNSMYTDIEIALYGVSMGGTTVLMASGEELPENVRAIVSDSAYSSVHGEFAYQLKSMFGVPAFPVMNFASLVTRARAGFWFGEGDTLAQVAKSNTPTLFLHGENDTFVPAHMMQDLYDICPAEKSSILIAGAGHGEGFSVDGEAYWSDVASFLSIYLAGVTAPV